MSSTLFNRGSEWRQWDLHIHTPASYHWDGERFDPDLNSPKNTKLVDEMIEALNKAKPEVFALMDYWTFDGWFALQRRLKEKDSPILTKTVFPGIELRLSAPTKCRLNAHVLFSDKISDQDLQDFKSSLEIEIISKALSDASLIELSRKVAEDMLNKQGFRKDDVDNDETIALIAGSKIAEISCESYRKAIEKVPEEQAIGFMPYDTSDGLSEVKWHSHYAYFLGLFKSSPIFESRKISLRDAFIGEKTPENESWFQNFQTGLDHIPRLVVSGSDAHCFIGVKGNNDKRGYGDFPSEKITWIKANPTFQGLRQAIREPAKRSFIGKKPQKLLEVESNKTFFIDSLEIDKSSGGSAIDTWLDGCDLKLNSDLVAIIGNKGSGKSALADILALLGDSKQKKHFSFLKKHRFRGKSGEPAKHFTGSLAWCDSKVEKRSLNDDPPEDAVELVRYIPQGHFEELCNDHVSGKSNAFDKELEAVIFSHADESITQGARNFNQLIQQQEGILRDQLSDYRESLKKVNEEISAIEEQMQPEIINSLKEKLVVKYRQIDEHNKIKPTVLPEPTEELSEEQQKAKNSLNVISEELKELEENDKGHAKTRLELALKRKAIHDLKNRIDLFERSFEQFKSDSLNDITILGLEFEELVKLSINKPPLETLSAEVSKKELDILDLSTKAGNRLKELNETQKNLNKQLEGPQLLYQQSLIEFAKWNKDLLALIGSPTDPVTQKGIQHNIMQIENLPSERVKLISRRLELTGDIFDILNTQKLEREKLYKPVQDLIKENSLIRDEYKLQFKSTISSSPDLISDELFSLIKKTTGDFRGEDKSLNLIRIMTEKYDFNRKEDILNFVTELHDKISSIANKNDSKKVGIKSILRDHKESNDVYDLLFSLSFLHPRYSLLFQDAEIEQLSPGQRGALLLIFYLLVDKGRNPIILDQPEENLDNETVVSLLVPVLSEAKKKRQIIMVTHNPNLAVVCDAEQVIYSTFERKNSSKITYYSGSIENPETNKHVVNVLEGTMPAFNNRKQKYF